MEILLKGQNATDDNDSTVSTTASVALDDTTATTPRIVEINLNEDVILKQIRKASLPLFAKKMAARILALCLQKNSGRLWFNPLALRSLRRSGLTSDAYDALGRLRKAGIITWERDGENSIVEFTGWVK